MAARISGNSRFSKPAAQWRQGSYAGGRGKPRTAHYSYQQGLWIQYVTLESPAAELAEPVFASGLGSNGNTVQAEAAWGAMTPCPLSYPGSGGNCVRKVGVCFETHLCLEAWEHICRHSFLYQYMCALFVYVCVSCCTAYAVPFAVCLGLLSLPGLLPFGVVLLRHGQKKFFFFDPAVIIIISQTCQSVFILNISVSISLGLKVRCVKIDFVALMILLLFIYLWSTLLIIKLVSLL